MSAHGVEHDAPRRGADVTPHTTKEDHGMTIVEWCARAKRGETYTYFRGDLAYSRHEGALQARADKVDPILRARLDQAADAWLLCEGRKITLTQRREGKNDFSYLAVRS